MINPCKDKTLLSAFLDGELSAEKARAVGGHLETCPDCRKDLACLRSTDSMLQNLAPVTLAPDFDRKFRQRVAELEAARPRRPWYAALFTGWRPVWATGLAAAIVAVFIFAYHPNRDVTPEELFISDNMDFFQNYDVIDRLDMLEQWDAIESMKEPS